MPAIFFWIASLRSQWHLTGSFRTWYGICQFDVLIIINIDRFWSEFPYGRSPDSEQIEVIGTKFLCRNSVSVEEIQDLCYLYIHYRSYKFSKFSEWRVILQAKNHFSYSLNNLTLNNFLPEIFRYRSIWRIYFVKHSLTYRTYKISQIRNFGNYLFLW